MLLLSPIICTLIVFFLSGCDLESLKEVLVILLFPPLQYTLNMPLKISDQQHISEMFK